MEGVRVDKWLWAARFFKTRSLATTAVDAGHVKINDARIKPAKEVRIGDMLSVRNEGGEFIVAVRALAEQRGSAVIAQALYDETVQSRAAREAEKEKRCRFADPAEAIFARPTKKDRRSLARLRGR